MLRKWFALALLGALLLQTCTALAYTSETTPWSLSAQPQARREDLGKIPYFSAERGAKDVGASDAWLWQAKINGYFVNLRLFAPDGTGRLFQEQLAVMTPGTSDLRLYLRQRTDEGGLMLQSDGDALRILSTYGIREILVADKDYYLQNTYDVRELQDMRESLGLAAGDQLCLGSGDDPVMIVDSAGRRRYATE